MLGFFSGNKIFLQIHFPIRYPCFHSNLLNIPFHYNHRCHILERHRFFNSLLFRYYHHETVSSFVKLKTPANKYWQTHFPKKQYLSNSYHFIYHDFIFIHRFLRSHDFNPSTKLEHPAIKGRAQVYRDFCEKLIF